MTKSKKPPVKDASKSRPPQDATNTHAQETNHPSAVIANVLPAPTDKKEFHECRPDQTPWWKTTLEVVALLVGLSALYVYGRQLDTMNGQLTEMTKTNNLTKQAMHGSERAWVGIEKITPNSFEKGSDVDSDSRFLLTVTFTLRNYGHSAAQHIRIFSQLKAADASTTTTGICDASKAGVYVGDVILPEQVREYPEGIRVTVADMESALKRQSNLILSLRGCIEYIDDSNEISPHHTPFSYLVTRIGPERYFTPDLKDITGSEIMLQSLSLYPGPTD